MGLEERVYSLLVVSSGEKFNAALKGLLPGWVLHTSRFVPRLSEAKRDLAEHSYDFVLVNSPLPDETGISFAADLCDSGEVVVLLLIPAELHDEIYARVSLRGVFTLPRPTSKAAVNQALRWMVSARERLRSTARQSLSLEEKMAEIRLVNRAKWILIQERGLDEPQAHRYIEKQAMDRCITKREVAQELVDGGTGG